jgi:LPS-assembly lipoprotein
MNMQNKRRMIYVLALSAAMMLSACGFQLRGSNNQANLPFKTIFLAMPETSPLRIELKRNIEGNGGTVVSDPKAAQAIIELLSESREKGILTLNTQGRVREYTLLYKLNFRVKDNKDQQLLAPTPITLQRTLSFNEAQVLAKEKEEEMLYRDMQTDAVQQILRRIAALKPV